MEEYRELMDRVEAEGCRAGITKVEDIQFEPEFRKACEANSCGNYGKCWMCPPDAGPIDELIARAKTYRYALVYQTIGQLEDSYDFEGMMEAAHTHSQLSERLRPVFASCGLERTLHLGAGGCHVCSVCAKRTEEPCRHPDLAMASLETYGVNVSQLARLCGMKYINGENTVTYFGTLLFTP